MKLFKKVAAVALAAVLALSMVGCGAVAKVDWKNEIIDYIADYAEIENKDYKHTTAMDTVAAALVEKAEAAYKEGNNVNELLASDAVVKAAKVDTTKFYVVAAIEDYQFKSNLTTAEMKATWLEYSLYRNGKMIGTYNGVDTNDVNKADVGVVNAKFGDKDYVVVLIQIKG